MRGAIDLGEASLVFLRGIDYTHDVQQRRRKED